MRAIRLWRQNNPAHLASLLPPPPWESESDLDIFFDCGTLDQNQLYPGNCALAESLNTLGIDHSFQSFVGGHADMFTVRFRIGIAHINSVMWGKGEWYSAAEPTVPRPAQKLSLTTPSPCSGPVQVHFQLPREQNISIDVLDGSGSVVHRLMSRLAQEGAGTVRWRTDNHTGHPVPDGVYFVKMQPVRGQAVCRRIVAVR